MSSLNKGASDLYKLEAKPLFKVAKRKGLPGKSFIHIVDMDVYLRVALSYLVHNAFFDSVVASKIERHHMYKDREKTTKAFLNYMCVYGEERLNYLIPSKFMPRSSIVGYLSNLVNLFKLYDDILAKPNPTMDELGFAINLRNYWGLRLETYKSVIRECYEGVKKVQDTIAFHYLRFCIKGLLRNRQGEDDPDHLHTDAWMAISDMIDSYNPKRSKVPFSRLLEGHIKSNKMKIIKRETWDLPLGSLVYMGSLSAGAYGENDNITINAAQLQSDIERELYESKTKDERNILLNVLSGVLPPALNSAILINCGIFEPFTLEEEIGMLLRSLKNIKHPQGDDHGRKGT